MSTDRHLKLVTPTPPARKRLPKSYKAWLKAKGVKPFKIERTAKQAGEYEFDHTGKLVPCKK